ncbi:Hsp20 family protein [Virgibacillus sp. 6R]|uniref:Hsp20/alpha crystallin family protein n=1 Tax=Metabacillus sp. 22489 TaxID=3453928 RepID=UPI00119DB05D
MNEKKKANPMNINGIEEWMTQFFIDPFTTLLDETTFRVDLFETNDEYIIEAEIGDNIVKEDIHIEVKREKLIISIIANKNTQIEDENKCSRSITLPFSIENKKVVANLLNGILEVKITKKGYHPIKQTIHIGNL